MKLIPSVNIYICILIYPGPNVANKKKKNKYYTLTASVSKYPGCLKYVYIHTR